MQAQDTMHTVGQNTNKGKTMTEDNEIVIKLLHITVKKQNFIF